MRDRISGEIVIHEARSAEIIEPGPQFGLNAANR
jgi:hypothetical protein